VPTVYADTGAGSVNLTSFGTAVTENFDTLSNTAGSTTNTALPTGWFITEQGGGTRDNEQYAVDTGGSNTGDTFSYGSAGATDRALGALRSGALIPVFGAKFTNNTGGTITSLDITYTGEQWRLGTAARTDRIDFEISTNASDLMTGTYTAVDLLDFTTPNTATTGAKDGNAAANRTTVSNSITGLSIGSGTNFFIRWTDLDASSADDGLSVDNFSLTANGTGPTNPTGVGTADPSSVSPGDTTLLTVAVTPGTNPASETHTVTANLSAIGGSPSQSFFNDGTNGDEVEGDNVFSYNATVANSTTGGAKTLPVIINETSPQSRTGTASIGLTILTPTNPSGVGAANPANVEAGGTTLLTVAVTPGANPTSTGITVVGDLSSIGGSGAQAFYDDGTNGDVTIGDKTFSFSATVSVTTSTGGKTLPIQIADDYPRTANISIALNVQDAPVPAGAIVISQVYGGGGNSGATLKNDFIELFNRSSSTINLANWSVQYASAGGGTGATWTRKTTLSGLIQPGQYYLIKEAAGAGGTVDLPTPDASGEIAMSGSDGKVALVNNNTNLPNGCPIGNPNVIDFVGYGTADCFEGLAAAPQLGNPTADIRKRGGCKDTDDNFQDFTESAPTPRNRSTIVPPCPSSGDLSPLVETVSPANGATGIDNEADLSVTFDEPVNISTAWVQISCGSSGLHTAVTTGGPTTFTINPDVRFGDAEQCTVTINKNEVSDQDAVDPPDNMDNDFMFTFTTAVFRDPAEHMVMGNPSGAVTDVGVPLNYLMMKPQYALSYHNDKGTPNWTSWHLDNTWTTGVADRQDDFRSDDTLPPSFKHVSSGYNFSTYGFQRGHMVPSADRTSSIRDNSATFLMTNIVPQAPGNNQGPWASMENYIRLQLNGAANELYIVSGGTGVGGNSPTGYWETIQDTAGNTVTVPQLTWKVIMVLPNASGDDVQRVDGSTRTFAVIMPNNDNVEDDQWQKYLATVDQVEALTGYDFYSNVPAAIQDAFEAKLDTVNDTAPVANAQSVNVDEDVPEGIVLSASDFNVNNVLSYTIVAGPTHGTLGSPGTVSCSNGACTTTVTYSPGADYHGTDSFTFKVNDGALDSTVSTVNITVDSVNDAPVGNNDAYSTDSNTALNVAAPGVLANDQDTEGTSMTAQLASDVSNGTLALHADGSFEYTPDTDFTGTDSFTYSAYDGTDSSNVTTVSITVNDKVGPYLNSSVAMTSISSSNSNLFNVGLSATATDNGGGSVTITVAVVGDENDETPTIDSTVHSPDAKDIAPNTLRLRGERIEAEDGRVYLIIVTATDSSGNVSRNYHTVVVPKGNSPAKVAQVNAQAAAALSYAQANNGVTPPGYFAIGDGPVIGPKQ
jgi:DNA/RNA endonuclease G (NUC1)